MSYDNVFEVADTWAAGDIPEAIVLAEFLKAGFPVLVPFGHNRRYDLAWIFRDLELSG